METNQDGAVTRALKGFKEGVPGAFDEIWRVYFKRLAALAGRVFSFAEDGEDAALTAFKTFHRRAKLGEFPKLDDSDDLWVVLQMLLWQKVIEMRRRNRAIKRGGKHSVIQGSALVDGDGNDRFELLAESDEDPMRSVEMTDLMETLMSHIHDKKALEIIALKREGTTNNEEIAARLGIGVASVYRKLNLVKDIWKPILDAL